MKYQEYLKELNLLSKKIEIACMECKIGNVYEIKKTIEGHNVIVIKLVDYEENQK